MSEQSAEVAPDSTHFDGCLTETTWDEDDCTCRPACSVCGKPVRPDGRCRWDPHTDLAPPAIGAGDAAQGEPVCVCGAEESAHPSDHGFVDAGHHYGFQGGEQP